MRASRRGVRSKETIAGVSAAALSGNLARKLPVRRPGEDGTTAEHQVQEREQH